MNSGPPERAKNVMSVAVAAEKVNISWVVGLSGGSRQSFIVIFRNTESEQSEHETFVTNIENPVYGMEVYFLMTGLTPQTEYEIWVRSQNQNKGGNQADSKKITVMTRSKYLCFLKNVPLM